METLERWGGTRKDYRSRTVGKTTPRMAPQDSHTLQRNPEQPSTTGGQDLYRPKPCHEDFKAELGERESKRPWHEPQAGEP